MPPVMTSHDTAIWYTIHLNELMQTGQLDQWPGEAAPFVMRHGTDERALSTSPYVLYDYGPIGDGTYVQQGGMFMATGRHGLAMTAGFLAAQGVGNLARRKAAQKRATDRWKPFEEGQIWVTQYGFYRNSAYGMATWSYDAINTAQLIGPGLLWFAGDSEHGPISWILESEWAELTLLMWANAMGVQHPQTVDVGWIPPGWVERVEASGFGLPKALSEASPLRAILPPA